MSVGNNNNNTWKNKHGASSAFGTTQPTTTTTSLFGGQPASNLFGSASQQKPLFGQTPTSTGFANATAAGGGLFAPKPQTSLFGTTPASGTSVFGGTTTATSQPGFSFGGQQPQQTGGGLFAAKTPFGATTTSTGFAFPASSGGGLFGAKPTVTNAPTFGGLGPQTSTFGTTGKAPNPTPQPIPISVPYMVLFPYMVTLLPYMVLFPYMVTLLPYMVLFPYMVTLLPYQADKQGEGRKSLLGGPTQDQRGQGGQGSMMGALNQNKQQIPNFSAQQDKSYPHLFVKKTVGFAKITRIRTFTEDGVIKDGSKCLRDMKPRDHLISGLLCGSKTTNLYTATSTEYHWAKFAGRHDDLVSNKQAEFKSKTKPVATVFGVRKRREQK